jgi:transglutaminase-like putative cysteine protease
MARLSAVLLLTLPLPSAAGEEVIGRFGVEIAPGARFSPTGTMLLRLDLRPGDPQRLAFVRARARVDSADGAPAVRLAGYPAGLDPVEPRYLKPSFLVDFDERPVQELGETLRKETGKPTLAQLESFVARYINQKDYSRVFDPASVVATRREGDCKAHAVLLTAMARMTGVPARLVNGLALVSARDRVFAIGHQWVEVHSDGSWHALDAALRERDPVARIPLSLIEDEGSSYMISMMANTPLLVDLRGLKLLDPGSPHVVQ